MDNPEQNSPGVYLSVSEEQVVPPVDHQPLPEGLLAEGLPDPALVVHLEAPVHHQLELVVGDAAAPLAAVRQDRQLLAAQRVRDVHA